MSKINYFRGEDREFVKTRDPGTAGRKRHRLLWTRHPASGRTSRGHGGLIQTYREAGYERIGVRNWCPCCVDSIWDRRVRNATTRRANKRYVHRFARAYGKHLCKIEADNDFSEE